MLQDSIAGLSSFASHSRGAADAILGKPTELCYSEEHRKESALATAFQVPCKSILLGVVSCK